MAVEFPEIIKFDDKVKFPYSYIQVLCKENEEKINLYKTYNEDFFEKCNINDLLLCSTAMPNKETYIDFEMGLFGAIYRVEWKEKLLFHWASTRGYA